MKVKVKICGIRGLESAQAAIDGGADFIGLNFVPASKRYVDMIIAKQIVNFAKGKVALVGVFQNAPVEEVNKIAEELQLDFIQLHGMENNEYIKKMIKPVIKNVQGNYPDKSFEAKYLLLDRIIQGKGDTVNLEVAKQIANHYDIFFAGGLTSDNLVAIITKVKPYAVDVAGGIETDNKEDFNKIKQFIKNAKGVEI